MTCNICTSDIQILAVFLRKQALMRDVLRISMCFFVSEEEIDVFEAIDKQRIEEEQVVLFLC